LSIPETDLARVRRWCEDRAAPRLRDQVKVELEVRGHAATVFECRPPWTPRVGPAWSQASVARLRLQRDSPGVDPVLARPELPLAPV